MRTLTQTPSERATVQPMLILSHISAYEFWRSEASVNATSKTFLQAEKDAAETADRKERILDSSIGDTNILSHPFHIIRPHETQGKKTPGIRLHRAGSALPKTRLFFVEPGLYVVSPEMCFLQLAAILCPENLALAGSELCGLHRYPATPSDELPKHPPVTTPEKIRRLLNANAKSHGVSKARRALRYIVPRTASPAEGVLALLLSLPCLLGGYGLEKPQVNKPIKLTGSARRSVGKKEFITDLYWPSAKLDIEYDGRAYHAPEENRSKDAERRNALGLMGIEVMNVTRKQLFSLKKMNSVALSAAKHLNKRIRPQGDFVTRQVLLRTKLIHYLRTKKFEQPGLYQE